MTTYTLSDQVETVNEALRAQKDELEALLFNLTHRPVRPRPDKPGEILEWIRRDGRWVLGIPEPGRDYWVPTP